MVSKFFKSKGATFRAEKNLGHRARFRDNREKPNFRKRKNRRFSRITSELRRVAKWLTPLWEDQVKLRSVTALTFQVSSPLRHNDVICKNSKKQQKSRFATFLKNASNDFFYTSACNRATLRPPPRGSPISVKIRLR